MIQKRIDRPHQGPTTQDMERMEGTAPHRQGNKKLSQHDTDGLTKLYDDVIEQVNKQLASLLDSRGERTNDERTTESARKTRTDGV